MIFHQHYLGCLSHASYVIGDEGTGRAVVVDPQRDIAIYLEDAERDGLRIERVIETHFHADFVSGHLELQSSTGAAICYGEGAQADFPISLLRDGERIVLGDVVLEVLATPGHTPESICLVIREREGDPPYGVLTGDTMFIGDVGRPDLLAGEGASPQAMAQQLYRSLHSRLLTLPDATRVFPAHGAGSACGRSLSSETSSTIGEQRLLNHALQPMSEDTFVTLVTEGLPTSPAYFPYSARRNREPRQLLGEDEAPPLLSLDEVLQAQGTGAVVLDTRSPFDFAAAHLRGAINVSLQGRFAEYAGDVIRPEQRIVLVGDPGHGLEAKNRLGRIGFDSVAGAFDDLPAALRSRPDLMEPSSRLSAAELERRQDEVTDLQLVDVRNPGELETGVIPGALHIPLPRLLERLDELDRSRPTVVHCASGVRSAIAASVLAAAGFADVSDLLGGYEAWRSRPALA